MIKVVIFDIDNTLTNHISWLKATELLGASVPEHVDIFAKFSNNELSYAEAKRQLVRLWQETGNNTRVFWEDMFAKWPLREDAKPLADYVLAQGYRTALITGSFDLFAEAIAQKLRIPSWYANTKIVWDNKGDLVDFHYVRDQAAQKLAHLQEYVAKQDIDIQDCVVIGDGDNDIEIFKATRHGIAIGRENSALLDVSWKSVDDLSQVRPLIGCEPIKKW